jgi:carbonic anhydrase
MTALTCCIDWSPCHPVPLPPRATASGETYTLSHADIHTPGEHQLRGLTFPLEVALVHFAQDGRPLVVSVLFECQRGGGLIVFFF